MSTSVVLGALAVLVVVALLLALFVLYVYWWLVQRPTPKLDGAVDLAGLLDTVEILRDKYGIPHIYAQNRTDLFFAQGYVHAQDRLWQMEQNCRAAFGTLAEVFGESALDADRFSRIVGFGRAAEAEVAQLDDATRACVEAYVAGVNAYIERHPGRLGAEFNLLRVIPRAWSPVDVVALSKISGWGLSVNWEAELTRLQLLLRLGPVRAAELEPDYPAQTPVILECVGELEATRLLSTAGLLLNEYEKVRPWLRQVGEGGGSNSWVLAPQHSATRRAVLCNDPHLGVQIPGVWYEQALHAPGFEVSGATFVGLPGVLIGHNERIAWGLTNSLVDQQDLYVERPHPDDPTRFEVQGGWEQAEVREEVIAVRRRAAPHVERVVSTRHGPLISNFVGKTAAGDDGASLQLALRWVGHMPGHGLRAILRLNMAQGWDEFTEALADWTVPAQNVTYADADGNIGYVLAGAVPMRRHTLGLLPAPGWDGAHEWAGLVPPTELPRVFNPASGKIVTANNKIAGDDYHHFLGVDAMPGWRAARLEEMLGEKDRYTLRDMEEMQLDTASKLAAVLTPYFAQLNSDEPFIKVAIALLRKWNYRMDADSPAATIYQYALVCLLEEVYGRKLGDLRDVFLGVGRSPFGRATSFWLRGATRLVELLGEREESVWYTDATTGAARTRTEVLHAALAEAVQRLRSDLGDNARRWEWGRIHQVRYVHPMGSVRLFRGLFNRGPFPVGGDATSPNQTHSLPNHPLPLVQINAGYRQIYEVGVWDKAQTVTATGQSGHPMSLHYADQMAMWLEGVYHPMPWAREGVAAAARYRMTLRPQAALQTD